MSASHHFFCKHFNELSTLELYAILKLRQEVFIVEQNCPYLDCDGKDLESYHLLCYDTEQNLVAHSRLLPEGISYKGFVSIGRVVSAESVRGKGFGKLLMQESLHQIKLLFGEVPIKIGAQSYLLKFYSSFGFVSTGEEYLEDGIPHTNMVRA
jgi:ElaA protein